MKLPAPFHPGLAWVPLAAGLLGLLLWATPLNERLSRPLLDWQQRLAAPAEPPAGVLVIDIDDASLADLRPLLGGWPFKRDIYALVVEQLRDAGARAIAIDLLLADAHEGDLALARAIARPGAPVVLAAAGLRYPQDGSAIVERPPLAPRLSPRLSPSGAPLPALTWPALALPAESTWPGPGLPPLLGVITTPLDADGRLRRLPLWHATREQRWPTFALAAWQAVQANAAPPAWALDDQASITVAFPGPAGAPAQLSFASVARRALNQESPAALAPAVRGQVVFIGSSALLADSVMTVNGQASGTAILAHTFAALRDGRLLRPSQAWAEGLLMALALVPALLTWRRGRAKLQADAWAALVGALAVLAAGLAGLWAWQMPTPWAAPLLTLALGFGLSLVAHQRWLAQAHRRLDNERALAAAANQAKSDFLANVSHEIRTPMNALLGVAELLAETPLNQNQQRHVQVFRDAGQSLHSLINDLLDLSKIEAGGFRLEVAPFSLLGLLDELTALQRPRAEQKGLRLELDIAPGVPDGVRGDRQRLSQALNNLLGNAIKFTPQGVVRLGVARAQSGPAAAPEPDPAPSASAAAASMHLLRFTVADSGIGIAASKLDSIFEPFVQADGSITRQYGGTGLGLSITRAAVQLMGGQIEVASQAAKGSVFTLTLPLPVAELAPPQKAASAPSAAASAAAPTILLAEDNEVNVYVFKAMLEAHCARIDVAPNGPTALEMGRSWRYDMIFMDLQMPGMDGLSVTRELRRLEAQSGRPRLPIVALTANAFAEDVRNSQQAGCDQHIAKPYTQAQLIQALVRYAAMPAGPDAAAAAQPPAQQTSALHPTTGQPPSPLDLASALARMGGDEAVLSRVLDHAAVFIERWPQDFDSALLQGRGDQMQRLAHDLRSIAASIGATALSAAAGRVEVPLAAGPLVTANANATANATALAAANAAANAAAIGAANGAGSLAAGAPAFAPELGPKIAPELASAIAAIRAEIGPVIVALSSRPRP